MAATRDVLVIGGGVIGLAIALELRLRGASVTLLSRNGAQAASYAAAGMLAPQAERLSPGAMLELCLQSRSLYPDWTQKLEALTGMSTGYWACGILAPVYDEESGIRAMESRFDVSFRRELKPEDAQPNGARSQELEITQHATHRAANASYETQNSSPTSVRLSAVRLSAHVEAHAETHSHSAERSSLLPTPSSWLARPTIHHHQPGLGQEVAGGWWYPNDAQVDNRLLTKALWTAVRDAGVDLQEGVSVESMQHQNDRITNVQTCNETMQAEHYILATGAWSQSLLPIPVTPRKGQMLSVRVPTEQTMPLQTVLFGSDIYLVPRRDGRIVIGATSEAVGFTPDNTPEGVQALLERAIRLYPALRHFPVQERWWGFRPATPDELPLLGASPYENLTLATGHYRNGILLAPVTAQLLADRLLHQQSDPLLDAFHWSRFKT